MLLIRRGGQVITSPGPDEVLRTGDELLVVGSDPDIDAFSEPRDATP